MWLLIRSAVGEKQQSVAPSFRVGVMGLMERLRTVSKNRGSDCGLPEMRRWIRLDLEVIQVKVLREQLKRHIELDGI